nr:reverse transcriptase domain-containing protein [Tanacetum cinerariifolium]
MVTKLRNEITNFRQDPNESLFEAWENYKLSIDRCPNYNMLLVTQIDTFYNGLTLRHRDTINAAAGGTFMKKRPEECYDLIENMTAHPNHWDTSATRDETSRTISSTTTTTTTTESPEVVRQLEMMNKNFQDMMKQIQSIKSVNPKCETCGGPYSFTECPAIGGYTQEAVYATTEALLHMPKFASTFKSLLSNKEKLFELASTLLNENCSAVLLKKLPDKLGDPGKILIHCDFPELVECLALSDLGASINLIPLSIWKKLSLSELTPTLDYDVDPRVPLILGRPFLRTARALINVHGEELTLRVNDEAITFKVGHTSRYSRNYYEESVNQINVIDVACEEYAQEVL